jgi:predicted  nucleic acid-binding Zn-ribbon protein
MDKRQIIFEDLLKQLSEWNEKFCDLETRLSAIHSSIKTNYSESIEVLHPEIKLVETRMAALRESREDVREELIHGLNKAIKDLKEAYIKASFYSSQKVNILT